ncbi:MAG: biopolymer transporter ExbD [Treponema sp.]|uniref:ExbD/TolR family protein n=1 Tax=Treponema sp. TaxID=166 RepID=UPI001B29AC39|nr:biopolymer transporter ExbD [Treponema sp.]MBO6218972.1 biopolymer transporter ExbD [Treponema sp.]MBQ8679424.1 biopolymer transporter ExbD [Treponema sp.]
MRVSNRKKRGVAVDLTPMIDVVFQLILFFLVSTTFALLPAINVNLPESSTAQGAEIAGITITVQSNGKMWFNDEQVSLKTLGQKLASFDTEGKKKDEYPVTLEADENVTNGSIVKIFDILREQGFVSINLRTSDK